MPFISIHRRPRIGPGDQRGVAAVEFALVVLPLLMIVFGVISFGIVLAQKAAISNGVRAGARYGSVNVYPSGHTCENVIEKTRESASTIGIADVSEIAVTVKRDSATVCSTIDGPPTGLPPCTNLDPDTGVSETLYVEATFPATITVPGLSIAPFDLTSTGAYRCEYR